MILNARILARRTVQPHRCFGSSTQSALSLPSQSARKANAEALASHAPDVTKFFQFSFHDLFGVQRSKLVPAAAVKDLAVGGAGFAGFAAHLDMDPTNGDLLAIPDASTCVSLPWNPSVAWVACDLEWDGAPLAHGPRNVLRGALDTLREASGFTLKTGVECEFFLLELPDQARSGKRQLADVLDTHAKPCYDSHALMRRFDIVSEVCNYLADLGWKPYQADHEDANGQFEINWEFDDALVTADRHAFFKYMLRSVAEKHGLRATFMPKPFADLTGNGCHAHLSLHDATTGKNVCAGSGPHALSDTALATLGAILGNAQGLTALTNPTVNSFKRIAGRRDATLSGATWSPDTVAWAGNNRTAMVRVPDAHRLELRLPDMAANPYLLPAGVAALASSALSPADVAANAAACPSPEDVNFFDAHSPAAAAARERSGKLPHTLRDAIDALEASAPLTAGLGTPFIAAYAKLRRAHWEEYCSHLSDWEIDTYLDS